VVGASEMYAILLIKVFFLFFIISLIIRSKCLNFLCLNTVVDVSSRGSSSNSSSSLDGGDGTETNQLRSKPILYIYFFD